MKPVQSHGAHKITMNSAEADYQQKKRAALAQAGNPYVMGVQDVYNEGPGKSISGTRTQYGAVRVMPETVLQGEYSNFEQKDAPGNAPTENYARMSGSLGLKTSAVQTPNLDPETFQMNELSRRLHLYGKAVGNNEVSLNNRADLYGA